MDPTRLCPDCYIEMKAKCDEKGRVIYHECPKCKTRILFTHSGH